MRKLIYYHTGKSSFVEKDIQILEQTFKVNVVEINISKKWKIPFKLVKQFNQLLFISKKNTIIVSQFAGFHSVIPSLFSKYSKLRSAIVLGGTDCVSFPSISYGNYHRTFYRIVTTFSIKHASLLLPVDESLIYCDYTYQPNDGNQQGYKAHIKSVNTPVKVIYNGYDTKNWVIGTKKRIPNSFVTIGAGLSSRFGYQLKGIDLFIEAARNFQEGVFFIVGGKGLTISNLPDNLILLDKIPNNQLNEFLQDKEYYLQLSMSEGFPNALCEAMQSGCIPIVSNVGAMPKIVENQELILTRRSSSLLMEIIKNISSKDISQRNLLSKIASDRINQNYNLEKRTEILTDTILNI